MGEKEFELFCREKFENPDFLLGRKTKKDTTEDASDYFVGSGLNQNTALDEIMDISDLLGAASKPSISQADTSHQTPNKGSIMPSKPLAGGFMSNFGGQAPK